ncbi:MAG: metallophosphoesterase [Tannerellaceae bacterium]|jgi:predicted MPP superfamily phosphohydrolase|nr:metallophosphoesterase [Tannerellaceae bacterium]
MWSYLLYAYIAGCIYLFVRGWQSLEISKRGRICFAVIFWLIALSFVVVRTKLISGLLYDACYTFGYIMLATVLYGSLILLVIDILRIIRWAGKIHPGFIYRNYRKTKSILFGAVCLMLAAVIGGGYWNAHHPRVTHLAVPVDKKAGRLSSLRIAMASDVHLGNIYGRKTLERMVKAINEQHPDIVLLVGDIFDGNPEPVIKNNLGAEFDRLKPKYGIYFVNGNHERLRGGEESNVAIDYLASHGIQPLLDTVALIDSSFYIAGRKDRSSRSRKTMPELLNGIDKQLPVILLDHQPYNLQEAEQAGMDLQLSGHTHHGQMWPLNYITGNVYEQDWGFLKKGKSNFYISCGVGTWGPPVRTSGHSEVVIIDLGFAR